MVFLDESAHSAAHDRAAASRAGEQLGELEKRSLFGAAPLHSVLDQADEPNRRPRAQLGGICVEDVCGNLKSRAIILTVNGMAFPA